MSNLCELDFIELFAPDLLVATEAVVATTSLIPVVVVAFVVEVVDDDDVVVVVVVVDDVDGVVVVVAVEVARDCAARDAIGCTRMASGSAGSKNSTYSASNQARLVVRTPTTTTSIYRPTSTRRTVETALRARLCPLCAHAL